MRIVPLAITAFAAVVFAAAAHAGTVLTVSASYDPTFTNNTTFTIENTSDMPESDIELMSGGITVLLDDIAPGASFTYAFNDISGPFIVDPGDEGLPDVTSYVVTATLMGGTITTSPFSPVANLTGSYVDFLGACIQFSVGCSVDPTVSYPLGGLVADAVVPEPVSAALLSSGLFGLAALRRRGSSHSDHHKKG